MGKCPFLSTVNERVNCFERCPLYIYEKEEEGCPFKRQTLAQKISIKDIDLYAYRDEENEEEKDSYLDLYMKNYR